MSYVNAWTSYMDTPVREFHMKFGLPIQYTPAIPPLERRKLRAKLILEEAVEFANASGLEVRIPAYNSETATYEVVTKESFVFAATLPVDLANAAKELADIRYVVDGANLEWGFPGKPVYMEVHYSNMSKLGEDGKPIYGPDGKVQKGPNTKKPDIKNILSQYGWIGV